MDNLARVCDENAPKTKPNFIYVRSKNSFDLIQIPQKIALQSILLTHFMESHGDASSNEPINFSSINSKYLKLALEFAQFFINSPPYISILPYQASINNFGFTESEMFLSSLNLAEQAKLWETADFLQFERLKDDICRSFMWHTVKYVFSDDSLL